MTRLRPVIVVVVLSALSLGGGPLLLAGCAGGDSYTVQVSDLADRFLPPTREVDYHPDSLGALSLKEADGKYQFELDISYEALHRRWSSSYQNLGAGRRQRRQSYATFWSKELSLASLQSETAFATLTQDRAQKLLKQSRQEYQNRLQIDVYWFESEGNTQLAGPGTRVELQIGDETYQPAKESSGPLREAFVAQGTRLYRRNTFYFVRAVKDADVLEGSEGMTLTITRSGIASRVQFEWEWPAN